MHSVGEIWSVPQTYPVLLTDTTWQIMWSLPTNDSNLEKYLIETQCIPSVPFSITPFSSRKRLWLAVWMRLHDLLCPFHALTFWQHKTGLWIKYIYRLFIFFLYNIISENALVWKITFCYTFMRRVLVFQVIENWLFWGL